MPSRLFRFAGLEFAALICFLFLAQIKGQCQGQTVPPGDLSTSNSSGVNPYETYGGSHENINLGTGNLNVVIPLLTIPGRDGQDLSLELSYDSKVFQLQGTQDVNQNWTYWWEADYEGNPSIGWGPFLPTEFGTSPVTHLGYVCTGFILKMPDGSKHSFPNVKTACLNQQGRPVPNANIVVGDSSGVEYMRLDASKYVTLNSDGSAYILGTITFQFKNGASFTDSFTPSSTPQLEDTNGNLITFSSAGVYIYTLSDTLKRQVTIDSSSPTVTKITYTDSNGQSQTTKLNYTLTTLAPTFTTPTTIVSCGPPCSFYLLSSIVLPNGLSYSFVYNNWGEITQITYPTGGYTCYEYGVQTGYIYSLMTPADFREVSVKHAYPQGGSDCAHGDKTVYSPSINGTLQNNQYMDVTDPLGNLTHVVFSEGVTKHFSTRETDRYIYQGTTTLLKTVHTDYNNLDGLGKTQDISLPIRVTTTLNDTNQVSKIENDYDSYSGFGPPNPTIDNVVERREFDYGTGSPGALIRKTDNTWLKTIHILDRKLSQIVYNGAGTQMAKTVYEYDNYTNNLSASGAVQHDSTFSTSYTTRGNLTAAQRWRNTDGALLTTRNQFDDAGNVLSTKDPLNYTTTFSYADSWGDTHCTPSGGNAAAYRTSVTNALSQTAYASYNSCAGTVATATDLNSKVTSFQYDLMNRATQINYPDTGQVNFSYNEPTPPLSFTTTKKITSSVNLISKLIVDRFGRVSQTQLTSDPDGTDYVDTTYDALGRKSTVSNPYRSTSDSTYGITTYNYDALSRVTKLIPPDGSSSADNVTTAYAGNCTTVTDEAGKIRKSCTDALGRLLQVFEPDASNSLVNETDYQYDALNNLTRVDQKGNTSDSTKWRTRTFVYDSLSELTSASNPESGTIAYAYDNDGNVHTKTDARSITITYSYL